MGTPVKFAVAASIIAGVTGYMAYLGTATSWKYYLTVDECLAGAPTLVNQRVRVSGTVALNSLDTSTGRSRAAFKLGGTAGELPVKCTGPLPDNLAEHMEVVVEGRMDESGVLQGDKVLTRCASKYRSGTNTASAGAAGRSAAEGGR